jgi:hypothetical protein
MKRQTMTHRVPHETGIGPAKRLCREELAWRPRSIPQNPGVWFGDQSTMHALLY